MQRGNNAVPRDRLIVGVVCLVIEHQAVAPTHDAINKRGLGLVRRVALGQVDRQRGWAVRCPPASRRAAGCWSVEGAGAVHTLPFAAQVDVKVPPLAMPANLPSRWRSPCHRSSVGHTPCTPRWRPSKGDGHRRALTRTGFLAPFSDKVGAVIAATRRALEERDVWRFWWGATRA